MIDWEDVTERRRTSTTHRCRLDRMCPAMPGEAELRWSRTDDGNAGCNILAIHAVWMHSDDAIAEAYAHAAAEEWPAFVAAVARRVGEGAR